MNKIYSLFTLLFVFILALGVTVTPAFEASASGGQCTKAPSGMVSWWPGDNSALDIVGSHDGILQNGTTFDTGIVLRAFSFDGVDDHVLVSNHPHLNFNNSQDFTIDAWVKLTAPVAGYDDEIVSKWDVQNFRNGSALGFYRVYVNRDDYKVKVGMGSTSGGTYELTSISSVQLGQWAHISVIRTGSNVQIYINGVLDAQGVMTSDSLANNDPLAIGGIYDTQFNPPTEVYHTFGGQIDEVEIFNRALTATEIAEIYNAGSFGKCREVTICHMPGEPAGKTLTIPLQAVNGHLDHGDSIGACP